MQRDLKGKLLFSAAISRNIIPGQNTHTHTHKTWKQQQFPNSESQNTPPKSQARSKRDAACKARDLKGTSPIII
jgi:hypothetical protein